jgi:hypothetical protein
MPGNVESVVNLKVLTADGEAERFGYSNFIVPVDSSSRHEITADYLSHSVPRMTAEELLDIDRITVAFASPTDPAEEVVEGIIYDETQPVTELMEGAPDVETPGHIETGPTPIDDLDKCVNDENPVDVGSGTEPQQLGEGSDGKCYDPCVLEKWVEMQKVGRIHSDIGLKARFFYGRTRETYAGVVAKIAGGSWTVAGQYTEEKMRGIEISIPLDGDNNHREVEVPYVWYKWRIDQHCGPGCGTQTHFERRQHHWDVENPNGAIRLGDPVFAANYFENQEHDVRLAKGSILTTHAQTAKRFEVGATIFGIGVVTGAGYSASTSVTMKAFGDCNASNKSRYVFGDGQDAQVADVLYAFSYCI